MFRVSRILFVIPPLAAVGFGLAREHGFEQGNQPMEKQQQQQQQQQKPHVSTITKQHRHFSTPDPVRLPQYIDHTALKPETSRKDIEKLCKEAKQYGFASVCINPLYVPYASKCLHSTPEIKICTVVGFPLGANSTFTKCCETIESILNGATEIDFVVNIGMIKSKEWKRVATDMKSVVLAAKYATQCLELKKHTLSKEDISEIVQAIITNVQEAHNSKLGLKVLTKYDDLPNFVKHYSLNSIKDMESQCIVKVILETSLLTEEEIVRASQLAVDACCDFVKTSTGFSTGGATAQHVALMKSTVDTEAKKRGFHEGAVKVKASGGIRNLAQAKEMIEAGADRIGASKGVDIILEDMDHQKKNGNKS